MQGVRSSSLLGSIEYGFQTWLAPRSALCLYILKVHLLMGAIALPLPAARPNGLPSPLSPRWPLSVACPPSRRSTDPAAGRPPRPAAPVDLRGTRPNGWPHLPQADATGARRPESHSGEFPIGPRRIEHALLTLPGTAGQMGEACRAEGGHDCEVDRHGAIGRTGAIQRPRKVSTLNLPAPLTDGAPQRT